MKTMSKKTRNISICCLCIIFFGIAFGLAKYTSRAESISSARVAGIYLSVETEKAVETRDIRMIEPGNVVLGTINISNEEDGAISEVTQDYTIVLESDVAVPSSITPTLIKGGAEYTPTKISADRKTLEYKSDDFRFGFTNIENHKYTLTLKWNTDLQTQAQSMNFTVNVKSTQVN